MAPLIGSGPGMGHCGASHRTPKGLHGPGPVSNPMAKTVSSSSELQPGIRAALWTAEASFPGSRTATCPAGRTAEKH